MKRSRWINALMGILAAFGVSASARLSRALPEAWSAWTNGDIALARTLADEALAAGREPDAAQHLLFLCDFVSGGYADALARLDRIAPDYPGRSELAEPALEAYIHLGRLDEAAAFAASTPGLPAAYRALIARHAAQPFGVALSGVTAVSFADHELAEYFPGFDAEINGKNLIAHVDTGGSFLIMGPDRAQALGIETVPGELSTAHLNLTRMRLAHGIADRFTLGDAVLTNVPVTVLPTLVGESDWVIFGTCILERFLSTLDYPNRRLILSRRGDAAATAAHLAQLPPESARVPFYLWGDHFMFARGNFGPQHDLNYFIDSGLVVIQPGVDGQPRQAAFTTSTKKLRAWGVPPDTIKRGFFEAPHPIGVGVLEQPGHYIVTGQAGDQDFGGVRIDGLLSHAFLKRYAWTIDFDAMEYRFAEPR